MKSTWLWHGTFFQKAILLIDKPFFQPTIPPHSSHQPFFPPTILSTNHSFHQPFFP